MGDNRDTFARVLLQRRSKENKAARAMSLLHCLSFNDAPGWKQSPAGDSLRTTKETCLCRALFTDQTEELLGVYTFCGFLSDCKEPAGNRKRFQGCRKRAATLKGSIFQNKKNSFSELFLR